MRRQGGATTEARQSTGDTLAGRLLPVRHTTPERSHQGDVDLFILQRLDGETSLEKIARQVAEAFATHLTSYELALERAAYVAELYGRAGIG